MRRYISVLLFSLLLTPALAQEPDGEEGMIVLSSDNGARVTIQPDSKYERGFSISLAGYEIGFAGSDSETEFHLPRANGDKKKRKTYKGRLGVVDFGFNEFTSASYRGYKEDEHGFLDLRNGKSIYFAVNPFRTAAPITRDGTLGFTTGLGLVWRNYSFDNPITLRRHNGRIYPVPLDAAGLKKSKLTTFSIEVPVMLDVNFGRFFVSGGVYGGLVVGSHTKYKKPKTKSSTGTSVQMFEYGVTARAGFRYLYVFGNYGLNNVFKSGTAPSVSTATVGFGFPF